MRFTNTVSWFSKPKNLWFTIFTYTLFTGLFVQLILLPNLFPSWHAGNGLLKGVDGPEFHRIALALSDVIKTQGWSHWELLPDQQLVSGIAAIFYTLIYPAPWSVLPVNAFLNATACVCLYHTLSHLINDRQKALNASLPFIFFPSNLLWNTQFHNENYAVPGVIFILFGWVLISKKNSNPLKWLNTNSMNAILFVIAGSVLLGLVRNYILSGMAYLLVISGIALGIFWLFERTGIPEYIKKIITVVSICFLMLLTISIIQAKPASSDNLPENHENDSSENKSTKNWEKTTWLPSYVDQQLQNLANYRGKFVKSWRDGGSSIDLDVTFENIADMIAYTPRSLQISFLAPFPTMWFSEGKKAAGNAMRAVSAGEMIISYICLLGLPFFIWRHRHQPEVWVLVFVCTSLLVVYAMTIPNIGALYRFRYPYYMPLVCLGLAGWLENPPWFEINRKP